MTNVDGLYLLQAYLKYFFCRFLVSTEAAELPVVVVLNKADLVPQEDCDATVREVRLSAFELLHQLAFR